MSCGTPGGCTTLPDVPSSDHRDRPTRPLIGFGPIDLFCLFAVVPLLIAAGILIIEDVPSIGIVFIVLAALVLAFDSWVHRPDPR
ncbi:hypothetical protein GCM10023148_49250 [Actinokineospora soli]